MSPLCEALPRVANLVIGDVTVPIVSLPNERFGTAYGGWNIATDRLDASSVIYSFGVGEDASFDLALIERCGVTIHGFDPTPRSIEWVARNNMPPGFVMHPYGLADSDGEAKFCPPVDPSHVSHTILDRKETSGQAIRVPVKRLATIMAELGHQRIDVLKMDIEGAEYGVIDELARGAIRPGQILVEFHHRFAEVGIGKTKAAIQTLNRLGYALYSVSQSAEEFCFVHEYPEANPPSTTINQNATPTPVASPSPGATLAFGQVPWTRAMMLGAMKEFAELYQRRPIQDNSGGMKSPHLFPIWFALRQLQPRFIVESGVWLGQGTWFFEQACPDAKLYCIDPELKRIRYRSSQATYLDRDFSQHDWSALPAEQTVLFFDDHQNAYERIKTARWFGLRHLFFEDNYPPSQGDCYSLKKAFMHAGYRCVPAQPITAATPLET
jgi:FkbM family methyltransferase